MDDKGANAEADGYQPHVACNLLEFENIVQFEHDDNLHSCHQDHAYFRGPDLPFTPQWEKAILVGDVDEVHDLREDKRVEHEPGQLFVSDVRHCGSNKEDDQLACNLIQTLRNYRPQHPGSDDELVP